jgi:hypothetical protein
VQQAAKGSYHYIIHLCTVLFVRRDVPQSVTRFQEHQIKNLSYDSTQQMAAINGSAMYTGESTTAGEKL